MVPHDALSRVLQAKVYTVLEFRSSRIHIIVAPGFVSLLFLLHFSIRNFDRVESGPIESSKHNEILSALRYIVHQDKESSDHKIDLQNVQICPAL